MIATVVITSLIAAALALAVRHVLRRGVCSACDQRDGCTSAGSCCDQRATTPGSAAQAAGPVDLGMPGGLGGPGALGLGRRSAEAVPSAGDRPRR